MDINSAVYQGRLYSCNLLDTDFVFNRKPSMIRKMEYSLQRSRDVDGEPYGPSIATVKLSVRLGQDRDASEFLKSLQSLDPQQYTILFNDVVSDNRVSDFRSGMVIEGFVYDVCGNCITTSDNDTAGDRAATVVEVCLKPMKITFLGENSTKELNVFID